MGRPITAAMVQQQQQIEHLRRQAAVADTLVDYIADIAGLGDQVAAIRRQADIENPAQPVPNPPAEAPPVTTQQAATPEATDTPLAPGQTPGSVQNVPADTTDVVLAPGESLPTAPVNQLVDVTAPVAGTDVPRPLNEMRTETDVRVGDPMNPQRAFPWTLGPDAQNIGTQASRAPQADQPPAPQADSERTMAAMHLAQLRVTAGIAPQGAEALALTQQIASDPSLSNEAIATEINTLARVASVQQSTQVPASFPQRAPAAEGVRRTTPSMSATASAGGDSGDQGLNSVPDEAIFD